MIWLSIKLSPSIVFVSISIVSIEKNWGGVDYNRGGVVVVRPVLMAGGRDHRSVDHRGMDHRGMEYRRSGVRQNGAAVDYIRSRHVADRRG